MLTTAQKISAVRRELMDLLRYQVEALNSSQGLSDQRLIECYQRQERVQELRERLQTLSTLELDRNLPSSEGLNPMNTTPSAVPPPEVSADAAIGI